MKVKGKVLSKEIMDLTQTHIFRTPARVPVVVVVFKILDILYNLDVRVTRALHHFFPVFT